MVAIISLGIVGCKSTKTSDATEESRILQSEIELLGVLPVDSPDVDTPVEEEPEEDVEESEDDDF